MNPASLPPEKVIELLKETEQQVGLLTNFASALQRQVDILRAAVSPLAVIHYDAAPARAVAPPAARKPPEPVRTAEPPRQTQQAGGSRIENAKALMVKVFKHLGWRDEPWVSKEFFDVARGFGMPEGSIKTYFTALKNEGCIIRIPDAPEDDPPLKLWEITPLGLESLPHPTS